MKMIMYACAMQVAEARLLPAITNCSLATPLLKPPRSCRCISGCEGVSRCFVSFASQFPQQLLLTRTLR